MAEITTKWTSLPSSNKKEVLDEIVIRKADGSYATTKSLAEIELLGTAAYVNMEDMPTELSLGTAATRDTGVAANQVPLNSNLGTAAYLSADGLARTDDLGTAAYLDVGLNTNEIPRNSDLGTAAYLDVGIGSNAIIQMGTDTKLPAVDGSKLTGITVGTEQLLIGCGGECFKQLATNDDVLEKYLGLYFLWELAPVDIVSSWTKCETSDSSADATINIKISSQSGNTFSSNVSVSESKTNAVINPSYRRINTGDRVSLLVMFPGSNKDTANMTCSLKVTKV